MEQARPTRRAPAARCPRERLTRPAIERLRRDGKAAIQEMMVGFEDRLIDAGESRQRSAPWWASAARHRLARPPEVRPRADRVTLFLESLAALARRRATGGAGQGDAAADCCNLARSGNRHGRRQRRRRGETA
mgnify:CR=1 FL=1